MARIPWLAFFGVLVVALLIRASGIGFESLWLDEGYQSLAGAYGQGLPDLLWAPPDALPATSPGEHEAGKQRLKPPQSYLWRFGPPSSVQTLLSNFRRVDPLCPPLFAVLLNRWMLVAGESDIALRALPALLSVAAVGAVYILAWRLFGLRAAIVAGILMAVSPFDIHYAQELRMYSLSELAATVSVSTLVYLCELAQTRARRVLALGLYAAATWALINSHYTNLFVIIFEGVYVLLTCLRQRRFTPLGWAAGGWALTGLLWLPWLPLFLVSAQSRSEAFYVTRKANLLWPFFALFVKIPANWLSFLSGKKVVAYAVPVYVTAAIAIFSAAASVLQPWLERAGKAPQWLARLIGRGEDTSNYHWYLRLVFAWALVPAICLWSLDVLENRKVIEIARYLMATAPAIYILAGAGLARLSVQPRLFWAVLAVHVVCAVVNNTYAHMVFQKEPWRQMAKLVEAKSPDNEVLVVSHYYNIVCLNRYLRRPYKQIGLTPGMGTELITQALAELPSFTLVTGQDGDHIVDMIPGSFMMESHFDLGHAVHWRHYRKIK